MDLKANKIAQMSNGAKPARVSFFSSFYLISLRYKKICCQIHDFFIKMSGGDLYGEAGGIVYILTEQTEIIHCLHSAFSTSE